MAALREIIAQAQDTLVTRSEKQAGLSRRWLEPALPELLRLIQVHRQTVDEEFRLRLRIALADAALAVGETGVALYPVGYCQHIRDAVWARLQNEKLIQEFRRRGLWWKKIYFIGDGAHFQNAIQLGDYLLDVAHNTIDANAEPVVCAPLGEVEYENLDDWVRYAEIAETYYHCRLFPNYYFPLAFPLAPFLAIQSTGRLELLYAQDLLFHRDLGQGWKRARALLESAWWAERRLPAAAENLLENFCRAQGATAFPLEFRVSTTEEMERMLEDWNQVRDLPAKELVLTLKKLTEVTRRATFTLRRADLKVAPSN
jgi:hypothetical protein